RRPRRRPRRGAGGEYRNRGGRLRSGPRQRSGHRRQGSGESPGAHPLRHPDALSPRQGRRSRACAPGPARRHRQPEDPHPRSPGRSHHDAVHRRDREGGGGGGVGGPPARHPLDGQNPRNCMMDGMSAIHHRSCNLCEVMCGLEIEHHEGRVLDVRGDPEDPLSRGFLCVKARALQEVYEDPDRLRQPLRRRGSDWEEVGWEEALDEIAARLLAVQARHGRNAVAVYLGNPTVHDYGAMTGTTLLETILGTTSRFSATSVDQLPRMFVSLLLYGHQALFPVPDVDRTSFFLVVGANPVASNGSLMGAPGISRRLAELHRRGGKVVVVDPRRTETAAVADEHHFIRPGTDALLLLAMLQVIFA